ncbi:hypothetical protein NDU88_002681 [Pleurodeles waltl]|uniref:Uncharacterized protein n=1 Tax=Pleurodeles waltl TaxID=8319 RepID=A0AAV7PG01_PLEWA|nr:hypothetical protein NDU88_002681 [Pleurodeles waltl]
MTRSPTTMFLFFGFQEEQFGFSFLLSHKQRKGLPHYIGDKAGTRAPRVTLPGPYTVSGSGSEEPDSTPVEEGVKEEQRWRTAPQGEPYLWSGERPAGICVAAGSAGTQHLGSGKPAARLRGRRGQRYVEHAPQKKKKKRATCRNGAQQAAPVQNPGRRRPCTLALRSPGEGNTAYRARGAGAPIQKKRKKNKQSPLKKREKRRGKK